MTITATSTTPTELRCASTGAFTTDYRRLLDALKSLTLPTTGYKRMPVLSRVLATVGADEVTLSTFDFESAITVTLPVTDATPGRMLLEHAILSKILVAAMKGTPKAATVGLDVTLDTPGHTPVVHIDGYAMPLDDKLDVEDFPTLPVASPPTHIIDRAALTTLVERVAVAADRSTMLPLLAGVHIELDESTATLVATDRYRLATGSVEVNGTTCELVTIPAVPLTKLLARLTGSQVRFGVDGDWVTLADDNITAQVRLIEGSYPMVAGIFNRLPTRNVTVQRADLLKAATRMASLSAASGVRNSAAHITITGETFMLAPASAGDRSKVTAPTFAATNDGDPETWMSGANPGYLLEAIATLTGPEVTFHLAAPHQPMILTEQDSDYQHVLMPVRITTS